MLKGKYIVLEGAEGVGKTTQLNELVRRFHVAGLPVRALREPDSQSDLTARAIRHLTQDPRYPMNTRTEVLLYNAARAQSLNVIKNSLEQGIHCIVDRNYLTTLAIQYYGRGNVPDYETINNIIKFAVNDMEPDLCIVLDAPVQLLRQRTEGRYQSERFDNLDESFLERVRAGYLWEAKQRNFPVVFATESENIVADSIWKLVSETLAKRSTVQALLTTGPISVKELIDQKTITPLHEPPININQQNKTDSPSINESHEANVEIDPENIEQNKPLIVKDKQGRTTITKVGRQVLEQEITDTKGDVYVFTEKLSPVTIAAAMARLSRRGDDMRVILLDEFSGKAGQDTKLLKRVITAYGDDSVQQLSGIHLVVENASNLLTKKLEWGRLAAYLEQSTRYIYFDQKDRNGAYKYFIPDNLSSDIKKQYIKTMDEIFELYSSMVRQLTDYIRSNSSLPLNERDIAWKGATRAQACDAARAVLPVATKSTVGIFASGQALESLILHLQSDELNESKKVGQNILEQARKVIPMFLERADKPERGGAVVAYRANTYSKVEEVANKYLRDNYATNNTESITLIDYWPKNELNLIPDMLYEHSQDSLSSIKESVSQWSYEQKMEVFHAYIGERLNRRHRPGRALEKAVYSWDIICDYGIFRDLQRHRMVNDLTWQKLTPRYGYEIPSIVEEANLTNEFEACFDKSLALYSLMQQAGFSLEAQYATLLGHKMRWKVTYNAREAFHLHELRTSPQGHPEYRKLVLQMHQKLAEVHPQLAEAMKFVNKDEDPELTRLAGERYTQYKLNLLK